MSQAPMYFRGKSRNSHGHDRERRRRSSGTGAVIERGQFGRAIGYTLVVALVLGFAALIGFKALNRGVFGVWASWQGELWNTQDLTTFLQDNGVTFEQAVAGEHAGVTQLKFEGYDDQMKQIKEEDADDLRMQLFREEAAKRQSHSVFVIRTEPGAYTPPEVNSEMYGAMWQWGFFTFRGDPDNIAEIRAALE